MYLKILSLNSSHSPTIAGFNENRSAIINFIDEFYRSTRCDIGFYLITPIPTGDFSICLLHQAGKELPNDFNKQNNDKTDAVKNLYRVFSATGVHPRSKEFRQVGKFLTVTDSNLAEQWMLLMPLLVNKRLVGIFRVAQFNKQASASASALNNKFFDKPKTEGAENQGALLPPKPYPLQKIREDLDAIRKRNIVQLGDRTLNLIRKLQASHPFFHINDVFFEASKMLQDTLGLDTFVYYPVDTKNPPSYFFSNSLPFIESLFNLFNENYEKKDRLFFYILNQFVTADNYSEEVFDSAVAAYSQQFQSGCIEELPIEIIKNAIKNLLRLGGIKYLQSQISVYQNNLEDSEKIKFEVDKTRLEGVRHELYSAYEKNSKTITDMQAALITKMKETLKTIVNNAEASLVDTESLDQSTCFLQKLILSLALKLYLPVGAETFQADIHSLFSAFNAPPYIYIPPNDTIKKQLDIIDNSQPGQQKSAEKARANLKKWGLLRETTLESIQELINKITERGRVLQYLNRSSYMGDSVIIPVIRQGRYIGFTMLSRTLQDHASPIPFHTLKTYTAAQDRLRQLLLAVSSKTSIIALKGVAQRYSTCQYFNDSETYTTSFNGEKIHIEIIGKKGVSAKTHMEAHFTETDQTGFLLYKDIIDFITHRYDGDTSVANPRALVRNFAVSFLALAYNTKGQIVALGTIDRNAYIRLSGSLVLREYESKGLTRKIFKDLLFKVLPWFSREIVGGMTSNKRVITLTGHRLSRFWDSLHPNPYSTQYLAPARHLVQHYGRDGLTKEELNDPFVVEGALERPMCRLNDRIKGLSATDEIPFFGVASKSSLLWNDFLTRLSKHKHAAIATVSLVASISGILLTRLLWKSKK